MDRPDPPMGARRDTAAAGAVDEGDFVRADTWVVSRRLVTVLVATLAAIALAAATVVIAVDRSIDRVDVGGLGAPSGDDGTGTAVSDTDPRIRDAVEPDPDVLTVLLLGSDSREVLTEDERRELGTGDAWGERTETIALVRLDPDADTIRMLSIPRDTLLTRCDDSRGRVNAAYGIGEREGIGALTCVVQTVRDFTGVSIDHVVKLDFRGFVDVVDALGGVPMQLDEPIRDRRANLDLAAGCTRLDGAEALAFVRARSIDDDFGRMARQQQLIEELRRELAAAGLFDDAPRLVRTAEATARAVELDSGLTLARIQQLVREHRTTLRLPVEGRSIPGEIEPIDGIAFLRVQDEDVAEQVAWLRFGDLTADTTDDDERPTTAREPGGGTAAPAPSC